MVLVVGDDDDECPAICGRRVAAVAAAAVVAASHVKGKGARECHVIARVASGEHGRKNRWFPEGSGARLGHS
jgi:hypothetical protein